MPRNQLNIPSQAAVEEEPEDNNNRLWQGETDQVQYNFHLPRGYNLCTWFSSVNFTCFCLWPRARQRRVRTMCIEASLGIYLNKTQQMRSNNIPLKKALYFLLFLCSFCFIISPGNVLVIYFLSLSFRNNNEKLSYQPQALLLSACQGWEWNWAIDMVAGWLPLVFSDFRLIIQRKRRRLPPTHHPCRLAQQVGIVLRIPECMYSQE